MKKNIFGSIVAVMILGAMVSCGNSDSTSAEFDKSNEITVVSREDGSGTRGAFVELFGILEKNNDTEIDSTTENAIIANKTGVVMTTVATDEYSIGYISLGSLNDTIKPVQINGVEATAENIKNGSYESARPFLIVTKDESNALATDFISFILSGEGQRIIGEGYIPQNSDNVAYTGGGLTGKLSIGGSTSVAPVMEKLVEDYKVKNPEVIIDIQETGSSAGISGVIDGTLDIGMSSRDLKDAEKSEVDDTIIAYDGIVVIVNNENPIENLSKENVKEIFTGNCANWDKIYE